MAEIKKRLIFALANSLPKKFLPQRISVRRELQLTLEKEDDCIHVRPSLLV